MTDRDDGRHIGPMAGDFHSTFDFGDDEETIATVDADGVALAAIQGLSQKLNEKTDQIDDLKAGRERRDERIDAQQDRIDELSRENEQLRERLAAVEARLSELEAAEISPPSAND
ncbi:hypothetical protein [Salinirussus salinus]|uniref:hypothetical protein n=1 Tax=Salinirussus salinus TaxID=1198300 RepID=UPI00135C5DB3|nr:hypothetical protein [Salinirussus salinus]